MTGLEAMEMIDLLSQNTFDALEFVYVNHEKIEITIGFWQFKISLTLKPKFIIKTKTLSNLKPWNNKYWL